MPETNTLELIDAALDEGRVTATDTDDRLLQELALMVCDEARPEPHAEFAREMDEWAAGGFGRRSDADGESSERRGGIGAWLDSIHRALRTPLGYAAAGTVAAAVVVAVVISTSGTTTKDSNTVAAQPQVGESDQEKSADSGSFDATVTDEAPSTSSSGGGDAEPAPALPQERLGKVPNGEPARIARQAQLTLETSEKEFQNVADQIIQLTDRRRGFVLSSSVSSGDSGGRGDFQLKIPADQLQATLRELSSLGDVTARSQTGSDVTREYVTATDRLQAARAERRSLLRRLAASDDDAQSQRLRDRLDQNAGEINSLRGQVRSLLEQTNYSTIAVTLIEGDGKKDDGGAAAAGGTSDALDDSLGLLVGSFNWLLRALGVLIPLGIVGGTAWWAGRTFRRRRREAVLF